MAIATNALAGFYTRFSRSLLSPLRRKAKEGSLSLRGGEKRLPDFALFSSNSDHSPEEPEVAGITDEAFLPPDDVDYLWKLLAGSVGGGAVVKYGSILFPDMTRPNLAVAMLMVSLSVLAAAVILVKESYSATNEDL